MNNPYKLKEVGTIAGAAASIDEKIERLHKVHKASQGKGDQGAFDVWNAVVEIFEFEI